VRTETDGIKLICEVSKPSAEVVWYKGDEELPEGGRYEHIADGRKRVLLIQDLRMDDAGEYHCKLPSSQTTGTLRINELAAEFISRPQSQEVVEGEKAEFVCSVSKDSYEVRWLRGDKELQTDDKYEIISDGKRRVLVVKNCERNDEGHFVALIGATRASIVLNCEVNTEEAKAKWLKNDETLFESSKFIMVQRDTVFSLRIKNAEKSDEATYTITLTNQRGEYAKSSAKINYFFKHFVYRVDKDKHTLTIKDCSLADEGEYSVIAGSDKSTAELIITKAGTKIELPADITGKPEPKVKWTKADLILKEDDRITIDTKPGHSTVNIAKTTRDDSATYIVEAVNSILFFYISAGPPSPPQDLHVTEAARDHISVAWKAPERNGGSPVTGYHIELCEAGTEKWMRVNSRPKTSFKITNLAPGTEYYFRVIAVNKYGIGVPKDSPKSYLATDPMSK
uniref:Uncharacterized protein n=1 Tax=Pygocentrus nattereri TaxID=42514 RepID=A0AAR2J2J5_PYGNA